MPLPCSFRFQKGQTIIEILVAIAVGAIVLTAVAASATITVRNADFAKKKTEAVKYVDEGIENVRIVRDTAVSWEVFILNEGGTKPDEPATGFRRSTTVTPGAPPDDNQATVEVTVSWDDAKGTHEVSSTTILTNWTE